MRYKIKSNEDLFNRWAKLIKKSSKKIEGLTIIQNDGEYTRDDLNRWYKQSLEDIRKVEKDFNDTIHKMLKVREDTLAYLKNQIE